MKFVTADHDEYDEDEEKIESRKRKIRSINLKLHYSKSDKISRVTRELPPRFPICELIIGQKLDLLPNDLIAEIFVRLPVKPLLKFRCLSRYWDSLISSKQFVNIHLQTNPPNYDILSIPDLKVRGTRILKRYSLHSLFLKQKTYAADILYCPPIHPGANVEVVDTVNGLCCLVYDSRHIVLWNPSTNKFNQLSKMDFIEHKTTIGFGLVNGSDNDYKVYCAGWVIEHVEGQQTKHKFVTAIYSLKTDSCRLIPNYMRFNGNVSFVCGKIHCLKKNNTPFFSSDVRILSFDLGTETEGLVPQPSNIRKGRFTQSLSKLGESLCLFLDYLRDGEDVWVMKDYGIKESWVKVVTIPEFQIPWKKCPTCFTTLTPVYVSEDGVILFASGSTFVIYNPEDGKFRYPWRTNFPLLEGFDFGPGGIDNKVNIRSLVSPFPDVRT